MFYQLRLEKHGVLTRLMEKVAHTPEKDAKIAGDTPARVDLDRIAPEKWCVSCPASL